MQFTCRPGVTVPEGWSRVGSAVTLMRERVRTEARSALDAGEAGRAGHQERVVYQCSGRHASQTPTNVKVGQTRLRDPPATRTPSYNRADARPSRLRSSPRLPRPRRPPRRHRLQPRVGRRRAPAHRRSPRGAPARAPGGVLRTAARIPIRRAGKHDRDRPRARRGAPRADLLALQRDARADGRDAARSRRRWSSICRTSAPASTPTSTRWPTA